VPRRFWHDWTSAIRARFGSVNVVGEVFDSDPALPSFFQGGRARFDGVDTGFDSVFDFPLQDAIARVFTGKAPVRELPKILAHDDLYPDASRLVTFLGLHDMPRFLHRPGATPEGLKQAFTFLFTTRGIPMIYYGDEIGMTGGDDPDNRRDFPGGWNQDYVNTFAAAGRDQVQEDLFRNVRKLARLRAETPALRSGALVQLLVEDDAYAFARVVGDREWSWCFIARRPRRGCASRSRGRALRMAPSSAICWTTQEPSRRVTARWRSSCLQTPLRSIADRDRERGQAAPPPSLGRTGRPSPSNGYTRAAYS
jgi:glycosidase